MLVSLIVVSLFCSGGTHILIGVDESFPIYAVNINGNIQYVDIDTVLVYEHQFVPPYGRVVVDTTGILTFATGDSGGTVSIWGIGDSGIDSDYWVPEDEILDEHVSRCVSIYNVAGQRILERELDIDGCLDYIWDGRDLSGRLVASGVYFVELQCEKTVHRKVTILK